MNGNKNIYDHHREGINKDVDINGEIMAEEYHNKKNNIYVNNEQGRMASMLQHKLSCDHHDVYLPPQTYTQLVL